MDKGKLYGPRTDTRIVRWIMDGTGFWILDMRSPPFGKILTELIWCGISNDLALAEYGVWDNSERP